MREEKINDFAHSRYGFLLMALLAVAGTVCAYLYAPSMAPVAGWGPLKLSPVEWFADAPLTAMCVALGLNIFVALLLIYINKHYNVLRSMSLLFAGMFLVMETALTPLTVTMTDGIVIAIVVLLSVIPLYTTFQRSDRTRRIFISFCLVSAGSLIDITCTAYLLALFLGCFQMRCSNLRTIVAALLGIITPWWIAWGFGAIHIGTVREWQFVSIFSALDSMKLVQVLAYAATSFFICIGFCLVNLIRIYSYNARTRAYNGFIVLLAVITQILILVDYNRFVIYLPMLNVCAAIQVGHFFVINRRKRSYIGVLCVIALYVALYLWNLAL
jgi:hypothetical protein